MPPVPARGGQAAWRNEKRETNGSFAGFRPPPSLPPLGGGAGFPPPPGAGPGGGRHRVRGAVARAGRPRSQGMGIAALGAMRMTVSREHRLLEQGCGETGFPRAPAPQGDGETGSPHPPTRWEGLGGRSLRESGSFESAWESNPPARLVTPPTGFEDQGSHRATSALAAILAPRQARCQTLALPQRPPVWRLSAQAPGLRNPPARASAVRAAAPHTDGMNLRCFLGGRSPPTSSRGRVGGYAEAAWRKRAACPPTSSRGRVGGETRFPHPPAPWDCF